jgi:NADH-quinone oxidoreductase subunit F
MGEYRLLLKHVDVPNYHEIQVYEQYGGYQALRKALSMERQAVIEEVKKVGSARARRRRIPRMD